MGLPSTTAALAGQSRGSGLASSSATASCQQLSHCGDSATPLPGPGTARMCIIHEGAVPGRPSPAHMQGLLMRAAAGPVILRGRGLAELSFLARPAPLPPEAVRGRQKRLRAGCRLVAR